MFTSGNSEFRNQIIWTATRPVSVWGVNFFFKLIARDSGMSLEQTDARRSRNLITQDQAIEIFQWKLTSDYASGKVSAPHVAKRYGITGKAVRDIWIGRTWYRETYHMDPYRSDATERLMRKVGRPKGARDLKPRTKKELDKTNQGCNDHVRIKKNIPQKIEDTDIQRNFNDSSTTPADLSDPIEWTERMLASMQLTDFADPFYDDWPHWKIHPKKTG